VDLTAAALVKDQALSQIEGHVSDSGEGRWIIQAADRRRKEFRPQFSASLYQRFTSRGEADCQNKLLFAMRNALGGHLEKTTAG